MWYDVISPTTMSNCKCYTLFEHLCFSIYEHIWIWIILPQQLLPRSRSPFAMATLQNNLPRVSATSISEGFRWMCPGHSATSPPRWRTHCSPVLFSNGTVFRGWHISIHFWPLPLLASKSKCLKPIMSWARSHAAIMNKRTIEFILAAKSKISLHKKCQTLYVSSQGRKW